MRARLRFLLHVFILTAAVAPLHAGQGRIVKKGDPANGPAMAVSFDADSVRVTGMTRGGTVLLFGVERTTHDDFSESMKVWDERLTDADADGEVRLELQKPMSPFTVLAVVDEADAHYVVATPGFIPVDIPTAGKLHGNGRGELISFEHSMPYGAAFVVRPGKGSWISFVADGTDSDDDHASNGAISIHFDRMKPSRGRSQAADDHGPDHLLPHDLVIAVNTMTLELYVDDVKDQK